MSDNPPQDQEILDLIAEAEGGLTPTELIEALEAQDYTFDQVIEALQRVFDRGLVQITSGARLMVFQEQRKAFA